MDLEYVCVFIFATRFIYVFTECPAGYHGLNCSEPCRHPNYGILCQHICNCTDELCNHITGCFQVEECLDGYYGKDCISPCRYPNYGHRCLFQCNCNITNCNHKIGCKTEIFALSRAVHNFGRVTVLSFCTSVHFSMQET